jgi:hypothetical protein
MIKLIKIVFQSVIESIQQIKEYKANKYVNKFPK